MVRGTCAGPRCAFIAREGVRGTPACATSPATRAGGAQGVRGRGRGTRAGGLAPMGAMLSHQHPWHSPYTPSCSLNSLEGLFPPSITSLQL